MIANTFKVQIPVSLLQYGIDQHEIQRRITEWLVLSLFTGGTFLREKQLDFRHH